jgi:Flp pilus assembly protein TadD
MLWRRPRAAALGVILLAVLAAAGWWAGRQLWAEHHLRAARAALERRDFSAADAHLEAFLAVRPDDGPAHLLAARCARRAGRYEDAELHLRRCRGPGGLASQATLEGVLLRVQQGRLGEDEAYLKRTITPDHPDAPLVLEALALGYAKTGRLATLLECTDLWLQVRPEDSQALYWRGYAWERFHNDDAARDSYARAVAADPLNDEARLALGRLLLWRLGRPQEALAQWEEVRRRRPEDPAVLLELARGYYAAGRGEDAVRAVDAVLAREPRMPEALGERGKLTLELGQPGQAEGLLREAAALRPDDREALYNLVRCLEQLGKEDEARTQAARLRKLEADLTRLDELIAAVGRSPDDAGLRCEAGQICLRHGRDRDGLHWLRGALEADPAHRPTHAALADYHERHGRPDLAAAHRRRAEAPGNPSASPVTVP